MSDEQRERLRELAQRAIDSQATADADLAERDFYMIDLSDSGIGDTELARNTPGGGPDGGMDRVTAYRIVRDYKRREAKAARDKSHRAGR